MRRFIVPGVVSIVVVALLALLAFGVIGQGANSSIDGKVASGKYPHSRVIWATARPDVTRSAKAPTTVRGVPAGAGRSRSVTSVTTPSVPSEPTKSPTRSRPATPLVVRRPRRTASP